jgi:hypothetical protein
VTTSIAPVSAGSDIQSELASLDESLKELKRRSKDDDSDVELLELTRNLATQLATAASTKMRKIIAAQEGDEEVDGRAFGPISTALEKVTRTMESISKRKRDQVEIQKSLVDAEVERLRAARGGNDLSDIRKLLFPFQGANRKTASPVLNMLDAANVKVTEVIDAEAEEIFDDDIDYQGKLGDNSSDARRTPDTDALPSCLA